MGLARQPLDKIRILAPHVHIPSPLTFHSNCLSMLCLLCRLWVVAVGPDDVIMIIV